MQARRWAAGWALPCSPCCVPGPPTRWPRPVAAVPAAQRLGHGSGCRSGAPIQQASRFRGAPPVQVMHDSAQALQTYNREIRQKNEQLREAAQLLEQRVQQRTAELAASREEALAAVKAKAGFLAVMSHEIRTPLNGVVGMSELLRETPAQCPADLLGVLKVSSEQLLSVVDDILDFSRIESGKLTLEQTGPWTCAAPSGQACRHPAAEGPRKGLHLSLHVAPDRARGGDRRHHAPAPGAAQPAGQCHQVHQPGRGDLRVWCEQPATGGVVLHFSVTDTGVGIRPERLGDLFQPFAQGDTSTTRVYGGTGLGLMICKHLVEMMGGQITSAASRAWAPPSASPCARPRCQPGRWTFQCVPSCPGPRRSPARAGGGRQPGQPQGGSAMLQRLGYPPTPARTAARPWTSRDAGTAGRATLRHRAAGQPHARTGRPGHGPGHQQLRCRGACHGWRLGFFAGRRPAALPGRRHVGLPAKPLKWNIWLTLETSPPRASACTPSHVPWLDETRVQLRQDLDDARSLRREIPGSTFCSAGPRLPPFDDTSAAKRGGDVLDEVQQAAHHLQGAAANVGAMRLAAACEAVESSARHQVVVRPNWHGLPPASKAPGSAFNALKLRASASHRWSRMRPRRQPVASRLCHAFDIKV
jgi:signal transduction histidine kinase